MVFLTKGSKWPGGMQEYLPSGKKQSTVSVEVSGLR